MPNFPKAESEIVALGTAMLNGLTNNPGVYPDPPLAQAQLGPLLNGYAVSKSAHTEAQAAAEETTGTKDEALAMLIEGLKKDLRYCERVAKNDNDKLMLVGWGARKTPEPAPAPGQPRALAATEQGQGTVNLMWKPAENGSGGPVRSFLIERRQQGETEFGPWTQIDATLETVAHLTNQPRGIDLEYRVLGANKGGESIPSNVVAVVL